MAKEGALDELLAEVLSRYDNSPNPRLKEVTTAAIRHLHAFAREVNLTREEWFAGIMFLTQCGKISDDVRQEFILLSDTTGVSTLVEMLAYDASSSLLYWFSSRYLYVRTPIRRRVPWRSSTFASGALATRTLDARGSRAVPGRGVLLLARRVMAGLSPHAAAPGLDRRQRRARHRGHPLVARDVSLGI